jgi:hypothetical protein
MGWIQTHKVPLIPHTDVTDALVSFLVAFDQSQETKIVSNKHTK